MWEIDQNGIPDTENPISIIDDEFSSGGTGNIPGAVDFFHSVMFNNDGTVLNTVDESFGVGCPPMTTTTRGPGTRPEERIRPAGCSSPTRRPVTSSASSRSETCGPIPRPAILLGAHGHGGHGHQQDLLVNAWYSGGVDVINFTNPEKLKEIACYDIKDRPSNSDNWSAYPYVGPDIQGRERNPRVRIGWGSLTPNGRGFVVFRANVRSPTGPATSSTRRRWTSDPNALERAEGRPRGRPSVLQGMLSG